MIPTLACKAGSLVWALLVAAHASHADSSVETLHHVGGERLNEPLAESVASAAKTIRCIVSEEQHNKPSVLNCDGVVFTTVEQSPATEADELPIGTEEWFVFLGCSCGCILVAALAAGLTLGLTSLEEFDLKVLCNELPEEREEYACDSKQAREKLLNDQTCAAKILPLISGKYFKFPEDSYSAGLDPTNEHYLLVTLLLANATANEALPLFLDRLVPAWAACILSVTVVLFVGEIIPSAIFTGPNKLSLAARLCPMVSCAKLLFSPLVWPISLMLDKFLGADDEEEFDRPRIKALIRTLMPEHHGGLERDEANMMHGVLEMHRKTAKDIGKRLNEAKMLPSDTEINKSCVSNIMNWGHSRIFVYRPLDKAPLCPRDNIMGVFLVKKLLTTEYSIGLTLADLDMKAPVVLSPDDNLLTVLNKFQDGSSHLGIVSDHPEEAFQAIQARQHIPDAARPYLFLSLEDVIEELLKEQIYDEDDIEHGLRDGPVVRRRPRSNSWAFNTRKRRSDRRARTSVGFKVQHFATDMPVELSAPLMGSGAFRSEPLANEPVFLSQRAKGPA